MHDHTRRLTNVLGILLALAGCGACSIVMPSRPVPEQRTPSEAEIQEMAQRMMGKTPKREAPVTTDGVQVVFQTGHAGGIRAVALSANGRYLASSGSQDETVKVWDVASGQEVRTLTGFDMLGADALAFNSDGTRVITQEMTGGVKVFDVATGREIRSMGSLMTGGAVVSGDGHIAVYHEARSNTSPTVAEVETGRPLWTLPNEGSQRVVALNRDGTLLVTAKVDTSMPFSFGSLLGRPSLPTLQQSLLVWDVPARKMRRRIPITISEGVALKLSPDGRLLLREDTSTRNLVLLDLDSGKTLRTILTGSSGINGMTNTLDFSPDGTRIVLATSDGTAQVFDTATGRVVSTLRASAVNFSLDGRSLVLGPAGSGAPFLMDIASGKETRLTGGVSGVTDLAMLPDGRAVVAAMDGGSAKLWNLATGEIIRSFECPEGTAVRSVAVSSTMTRLAMGCVDGSAWLWDVATGQRLFTLVPSLAAGQFVETVVRFSGDGRLVVVGVREQLTLWDAASGKELRRLTLPHGPVPETIEQLDRPSAAYEGLDPRLKGMMLERAEQQPKMNPKTVAMMKETAHWIRAAALHPNGHMVAVGKAYETSLWDLDTGQLVHRFGEADRRGSRINQPRLQGIPSPSNVPSMMMADPSEFLETSLINMGMTGAQSLVFSPDGRTLLTGGHGGKRVWDVATGQAIRTKKASGQGRFDPMSMLEGMDLNVMGTGVAFSPDGRLAARGHGEVVKVWDVATGQDRGELTGHSSAVKAVAFTPDGRSLVSGGGDGAVRIWGMQDGKEKASLVAIGGTDFVTVTPDQYYRASKSRIKGVAFRVKEQLYPFEQFDLRFNRPDIVLQRLGWAPPDLVQSYRTAYERRLKKMGLSESMLGRDFHLPEVEWLTKEVAVTVSTSTLSLKVKAADSKYRLDRFNVFVNGVPVHGTAGLPLPNRQSQTAEQEIQVPLVPGRNKIQVSVLNQQGVESLRQTVYTTSSSSTATPHIYVVAIGVSQYKNTAYNLRYAAKDAADLLTAYKTIEQRQGVGNTVHVLSLTNQQATRAAIIKAKEWLAQSKSGDLVVVFAAGHGMTDEQSNYFFGTHDIDPQHPATNGLPYEEFETLLDGIPALQKLLLLDTCFSGEIDKDQAIVIAQAETNNSGTVKMRAFKAARGITVTADDDGAAAGNLTAEMLKFQQDWFADLRRGTGAAVISSSSGNEYSLEGEQWKNGVFTYALLDGLQQRHADTNKDQTITVSELQAYVIDQVRLLTQGGQNPTIRRENLEYDFAVY